MIKKIIVASLTVGVLGANPITLTKEQEQDWQIEVAKPTLSNSLTMGEFMAEVVTPPQHLQTVSLPFEAQIKKLYVATFEKVKKGQLLAEVTGQQWIEIQKQFIADAIELKHHGHLAERKNRLCNEGIIAKKECKSANAEHSADKVKASASKALLKEYGANDKMIHNLFENLKISKSIKLYSKVSGRILELNVRVGKSVSPSDALFVIQKEGALWLEVELPIKKASLLQEKQSIEMKFNNRNLKSKVLLKSPLINQKNQTQMVRFLLPNSSSFIAGMRDTTEIKLPTNSFKVTKKSVISGDDSEMIFVKRDGGYAPLNITILGEDKSSYYIKGDLSLNDTIAVSSLAILKGLMEGEDE